VIADGSETLGPDSDRRRDDRRDGFVRLADYTIPEVRKALLTGALLTAIFGLFLYMIHDVLVAVIVGVVLAVYLLPFHLWTERRLGNRRLTAVLVIVAVIVPLVVITAYSWIEISSTAEFLNDNRDAVATEITEAVQRLPFAQDLEVREDLSRWVAQAASRSTSIVEALQETLDILVLSIAVFLFTLFYILTDHERIVDYIRSKIPGRYRPLGQRVTDSIRQVAYGALYATFLTQIIKALIILAMNLIWDVPLAVVLAIAAFFIGFLPIVGSWSVYVPVAIYLMVFRDNMAGGIIVLLVGFLANTVFISLYLRPKIAAAKAGMLNFYWMFLALITGVYTFGLVGIIIGPILIGVLQAVFESVVRPAPLAELSDALPLGEDLAPDG
jgi:predicted PurR-regulated permease PerM